MFPSTNRSCKRTFILIISVTLTVLMREKSEGIRLSGGRGRQNNQNQTAYGERR